MNRGINNELKIANCINNKKFSELNPFLQRFMKSMFSNLNDDSVFEAKKFNKNAKPDIYISCQNQMKFISIKSGRTDSLHFEEIKPFILFLRGLGVSKETQKTILLFHYGDGTMDGSGIKRKTYEELIPEMKEEIEKANRELNTPRIIIAMYNRAAVKGNEYRSNGVDFFYYGDEKYGVYVSKDDMLDFILSKKHYSFNTLHIGPMIIQPYLRDVNDISKNKFKRNIVQIKWHYFLADMEYAIKRKENLQR